MATLNLISHISPLSIPTQGNSTALVLFPFLSRVLSLRDSHPECLKLAVGVVADMRNTGCKYPLVAPSQETRLPHSAANTFASGCCGDCISSGD